MADLTTRQRQHLKGLAHHLNPVVHVGKDGLSDPVRRQIREALERHELIKVKLTDAAPMDKHEAADELPAAVGAFHVQTIGKTIVLYRPHPEKPRIELPWPAEEEPYDEARDLAESRAPRERTPGTLTGSVRERGRVAPAPPIPPKRPAPRRDVAPREAPRTAARGKKAPARGKGTPKGGRRPAPRGKKKTGRGRR